MLETFPEVVEVLHLEVADGCAPDPTALDAALQACEQSVRKKRGVYILSRLGHGRANAVAACLLGKLYGLRAHDALDRVTRYLFFLKSLRAC